MYQCANPPVWKYKTYQDPTYWKCGDSNGPGQGIFPCNKYRWFSDNYPAANDDLPNQCRGQLDRNDPKKFDKCHPQYCGCDDGWTAYATEPPETRSCECRKGGETRGGSSGPDYANCNGVCDYLKYQTAFDGFFKVKLKGYADGPC